MFHTNILEGFMRVIVLLQFRNQLNILRWSLMSMFQDVKPYSKLYILFLTH